VRIYALIAKPFVKVFHVSILHRPTRLDVYQRQFPIFRSADLTVICNLETGQPGGLGKNVKTLDNYIAQLLSIFQRSAIRAACVDMWELF
jgi:hypothetical protein